MKKSLSKAESLLIYLLPIVVFFSYYPVIRLGANDSMNFELSLPLIWLAIFGCISMFKMPTILTHYGVKKSVLILLFPVFAVLSIFWSANPLRGVLTAGILWLIFMSVVNIINIKFEKGYLKRVLSVYMAMSVLVSIICIVQCFADVLGANTELTLLCPGCVYTVLGFPHPNGLAIEPQFMGNLLIAPALISLLVLYNAIKDEVSKRTLFGYVGLSIFLIMTLYICFSRGALYAFGLAGAVMGVVLLVRDKSKYAFWLLVPVILGCGCGLLLQGVWADISPTSENFAQGIQRSIHQITLGKVDLREQVSTEGEQSTFSGYIEESTNVRLNLNEIAFGTWSANNKYLGVGIGGAGVAMSNYSEEIGSKEIVQNEYVNILLELGVVGIIFLIILIVVICKNMYKLKGGVLLVPIIVAYVITLCFFSGFPNVLHIYLMTPILYWVGQKRLLC